MSSSYQNVVTGKLKLAVKSKVVTPDELKKRKHHHHHDKEDKESSKKRKLAIPNINEKMKSDEYEPVIKEDTRTEAEKKFEEARKAREKSLAKEMARKSHRERISEFNEKMCKATEYYEMPKIASAGLG